MTMHFTHADGLQRSHPYTVYASIDGTTPHRVIEIPQSLTPSCDEHIIERANLPAFGAFLLATHAFAIAYTDLFEATVFGGRIGPIFEALMRACRPIELRAVEKKL